MRRTTADPRLESLTRWTAEVLGERDVRIAPASADASFRRYFRITRHDGGTLVAMDAPPDREDIGPYLHVARLLAGLGVHVPRVHEVDSAQGFVLLEDLGTTPYLPELRRPGRAAALYGDALATLLLMQSRGGDAAMELAPYDAPVLEREMQLMPEWFLARHLETPPDAADLGLLRATFDTLIAECEAQPRVFVHRDYHSRNLMVLPEGNPGVIDFQDALRGPIGYDLVSLLKDCYIAWPRAEVERWLRDYRDAARARGLAAGSGFGEFLRWFDMVGVQRHVKVLGIFARLWHRDGKIGYLDDLPLTLDYVRDTSARYVELQPFARWIERRIVPALPAANARQKAAARTAGAAAPSGAAS